MTEVNADAAARKKALQRERGRRWRQANAAKNKEQKRQWWEANRERVNAENRRIYADDPERRAEVGRRNREWQQANRSHLRQYKAAWYGANSESVRERVRQNKEENREAYRESAARRYAANPGKWRAAGMKHRHRLDDAGWARMWAEQEGRCYLCRRELDLSNVRKVVVEHWHGCSSHDPKFSCNACRRGLACNICNFIVGTVGDDPELLRLIASNLEAANAMVQARQADLPHQLMLEEAEVT